MDNPSATSPAPAPGGSYDETPYPSSSFPESHPHSLCAMARLFGLKAPETRSARVLELGCANGANLLPMAQHMPAARFLGIDLSAAHVTAAQAAIAAAGLTNVEVRQQNVLDFPAAEGKFDYIIAHGVFSWVPDEVADRILAICRRHLVENGVAYVSYNALPGWGMRMALRDMMLFHTAGIPDGKTKVTQSRALISFLADSVATEGNPYGLLLKQELQRMSAQPDGYIRHDILGDTNKPVYFHQFAKRAMASGLQYLSESSLAQMLTSNFPEKVAKTLDQISGNIVAKEQYMDFIRNRSFRRSLLCHREISLERNLSARSITSFYFTSQLAQPEPGSLDLAPGVNHSFKLRSGGDVAINVSDSFLKAAFERLSECGLTRISFTDLLAAGRARSGSSVPETGTSERAALEEATLASNLMSLYTRGLVEIYADAARFAQSVGETPRATPLARYQALNSAVVTNHGHLPVTVDLIGRYVLAACDGTKNQAAIVEYLVGQWKEGTLKLSENDQPVTDEARVRLVIADRVPRLLGQIAALGFLTE